jgi:hypothetical protein
MDGIKKYCPLYNDFERPYNIEMLEMGVWDTIDVLWDWFDALYVASSHAEYMRENLFRIMDNNNRVI